jgi:hypothetical protein
VNSAVLHTNTLKGRNSKWRKIVWSEYISLDGVVEEPGEWSIPYFSDDLAQYESDELAPTLLRRLHARLGFSEA